MPQLRRLFPGYGNPLSTLVNQLVIILHFLCSSLIGNTTYTFTGKV